MSYRKTSSAFSRPESCKNLCNQLTTIVMQFMGLPLCKNGCRSYATFKKHDNNKKYFKYRVWTRCGIPKVTLEGTLEDWENLKKKVVKLRELSLDMDFWLDRLEPVVLMKRGGGSGTPASWDGWIAIFFPYEKSDDKIFYNNIVTEEIPDGMVNVSFDTDLDKKLQFSAGFLGAHQTTIVEGADIEVFISSVIGWLVVDH
ncbi:hypothetical protein G9A89_011547 [Geosiphon pyriformis]|nr:hypothetical protein G9A89_011547 [Geosiphon pyriformis]